MNMPRFVVVHVAEASELEVILNAYPYYEVIQMTSGPRFEKSGPDNTLEQTGDSIYVILERQKKFRP